MDYTGNCGDDDRLVTTSDGLTQVLTPSKNGKKTGKRKRRVNTEKDSHRQCDRFDVTIRVISEIDVQTKQSLCYVMYERKDARAYGPTNEQTKEPKYGRTKEQTNGRMNDLTNEQTDGRKK
ncbi:hypothetical protein DPMN_128452 [Dreissena polymorpha]|uniref:Uncharacterized protein n=1 Tax=Dreissena polymorpha TaxID=45954 RepID=A0A9D4GZH9_DREPO|nr:hypothetical protein DPMN_057267 [Dreissena polymorpha]KAH3826546.1 hypothetical protein DPMN_128452 [Dreissena polymorpha]